MAEGLADDERSSVGGDHHAVREEELVGNHGRSTIRTDEDDHTGFDGLGRRIKEIVADVPHVQTAFGVHDAVAQAELGQFADIGHLLQAGFGLAVNPALKRVTNHDRPLGSEPEAVRDKREFQYRCDRTGKVHGFDPLVVDIEEPQLPVVPAGTLRELEALCGINQGLDVYCHSVFSP